MDSKIGGWGCGIGVVRPPNREIDFDFVSCSCRACERAGEAKLRGRVRGVLPHGWALELQIIRLLVAVFGVTFDGVRVGFKPFRVVLCTSSPVLG